MMIFRLPVFAATVALLAMIWLVFGNSGLAIFVAIALFGATLPR